MGLHERGRRSFGRRWPTGSPLRFGLVGSTSEAVGGRPVAVIGMHRSGTSVTAHTLVELGLSTSRDDLIAAGPYNERGYWESQTVSTFDESVLRQLGGTWSAPPLAPAGWETTEDAAMEELKWTAADLAADMLPRMPTVMKDPRLCLTLPLWRSVLSEAPVAVLVFRDPIEVALSLQQRDGFPVTLGLALWHRYVCQSLRSVVGLPVLAVEYARMLDDPSQFVRDLSLLLEDNGIRPGSGRADQAAAVLTGDLRHQGKTRPDMALDSENQPLLDLLRASLGLHEKWAVPELPEEPLWVEDVIRLSWAGQAVTAALQVAQDELKWVKRSRLFRATHAIWRVTSTGPARSPADSLEADGPSPNGIATPTSALSR